MGTKEFTLYIIKSIYDKLKANIISGKKAESIPKIRNRTRMSTVTTVILHSSEVLAMAIREEKEKESKLEKKK